MNARRFTLDTNVLVYAADSRAGAKHAIALAILDRAPRCDSLLALQVLGEFYAAVTRKSIVSPSQAAQAVRGWLATFETVAASNGALRSALDAAGAGRLSFWDAMLLATAREAGCSLVISEDMGDGTRFHGLIVRNPFAGGRLPADLASLLGNS